MSISHGEIAVCAPIDNPTPTCWSTIGMGSRTPRPNRNDTGIHGIRSFRYSALQSTGGGMNGTLNKLKSASTGCVEALPRAAARPCRSRVATGRPSSMQPLHAGGGGDDDAVGRIPMRISRQACAGHGKVRRRSLQTNSRQVRAPCPCSMRIRCQRTRHWSSGLVGTRRDDSQCQIGMARWHRIVSQEACGKIRNPSTWRRDRRHAPAAGRRFAAGACRWPRTGPCDCPCRGARLPRHGSPGPR